MLDFTQEPFGKPITLKNKGGQLGANAMISQFLNIKSSNKKRLLNMVNGDNHSCRYFCNDDCAYIFDVKIIKAIVAAIEEQNPDDGGCLVLFQGLRRQRIVTINSETNVEKEDFHFGRPTLIATAYKKTEEGLEMIKVKYESDNYKGSSPVDAFEHPGDGNGGTTLTLENVKSNVNNLEIEIPDSTKLVVVERNGADDETDYVIKQKLTEFQGWMSV